MGMPLENAYLFHGHTGRDFAETYYWKSHQEVLEKAGLELVYPTAGVSEIINHKIVENSKYSNLQRVVCVQRNKGAFVENVGSALGKTQ